jgi:hypothetical protein
MVLDKTKFPVMYMMIGLPTYDARMNIQTQDAIHSFMNIAPRLNVHVVLKYIPGDSLIPRARNNITESFMNSEALPEGVQYSYLLFIDSDIIFDHLGIVRLLIAAEPQNFRDRLRESGLQEEIGNRVRKNLESKRDEFETPEKFEEECKARCDNFLFFSKELIEENERYKKQYENITRRYVVGGVYPLKKLHTERFKIPDFDETCYVDYCVRERKTFGKAKGIDFEFDNVIEADYIGTGFLMIHRDVFEKCKEYTGYYYKPEEIVSQPDEEKRHKIYDYFPSCPNEEKHYVSEDWGFLDICHRSGFKSYARVDIALSHIGIYVYKGNYMNYLSKTNRLNGLNKDDEERLKQFDEFEKELDDF